MLSLTQIAADHDAREGTADFQIGHAVGDQFAFQVDSLEFELGQLRRGRFLADHGDTLLFLGATVFGVEPREFPPQFAAVEERQDLPWSDLIAGQHQGSFERAGKRHRHKSPLDGLERQRTETVWGQGRINTTATVNTAAAIAHRHRRRRGSTAARHAAGGPVPRGESA